MKDIDKIQDLTPEELAAIANGSDAGATDAGAREIIGKLELAEELRRGNDRRIRIRWITGIAAAAIVALTVGLSLQYRGPKDTFDDPALAYAKVQEVFGQISSGMQQGVDAVGQSGQMISDEIEKTINKLK